LVNRLKDGVPNLLFISYVINWNNIHTDVFSIFLGVIIFICGQICWHCFSFLFALPVFKLGKNKQLYETSITLGNTNNIPYEGFNKSLKFVLTYIVPSLIIPQILASVLLGKSDGFFVSLSLVILAGIFLYLKERGWKWALKNYTSATS